jgi:hypothetical protein
MSQHPGGIAPIKPATFPSVSQFGPIDSIENPSNILDTTPPRVVVRVYHAQIKCFGAG